MFKNILMLFIVLLFIGCSTSNQGVALKPSQKAFAQEDLLILLALRAEELNDYKASSNIFETLYEKSNKKEYLSRSIQSDLMSKQNQKVVTRVDAINGDSFKDHQLVRYKILALSRLGKIEEAKANAIKLVEASDALSDYLMVSNIYITLGKYDMALKYLESAYAKNLDEKILDKMAVVLYVNLDRKKDAIAQLESYSLMHGCSPIVCTRLISFYSEQNNIDGLLSVYLKMYKEKKQDKIAKQIVQIYGYKKDYAQLMKFLQKNKIDNSLLLQLYIQAKKYKEASFIANELYENSGEINYLGQSAIFEYEGAADKNDKKMHKRVIQKLKQVLAVDNNPLYLNYIGYLLIDHEIDIKKGIKYIKTALGYNPASQYYLDSLAWGYYKLGECSKAEKIMKKIMKIEGSSTQPEVKMHYEKIKKCKSKKTKKRKGTKNR